MYLPLLPSFRGGCFMGALAGLILAFSSTSFGRDPELHLMFAVDGSAGDVGDDTTEGCNQSAKRLKSVLAETFEGKESRYHIYSLETHELDSMASFVRGTFKDVHPDDTVWFYYCGHGASDDDEGHFFATSQGNVTRSSVVSALEATGARLTVLMTEMCSSPGQFSYQPSRRQPASWDAFDHLFFRHRGMMDFTAATYPEFGWVNSVRGGFFTQAIARALCEPVDSMDTNADGFVSWEEAFNWIRNDTSQLFQSARSNALEYDANAKIGNSTDQTPYAFSLPRYEPRELGGLRWERELKVTNNTDGRLCIWGRCYTEVGGDWAWLPSQTTSYAWELEPGETTYLGVGDLGRRFAGATFDLWGNSGNATFNKKRVDYSKSSYRGQKNATLAYNFNYSPTVTDVSVSRSFNVYRFGKKGLLVRLSFIARRFKHQTVRANILFFKQNGTVLRDNNGRYATSEGQVGTAVTFQPQYLHTKFSSDDDEPVELFLPYDELHVSSSVRNDLYFRVHFDWNGTTVFSGTRNHSFYYGGDS